MLQPSGDHTPNRTRVDTRRYACTSHTCHTTLDLLHGRLERRPTKSDILYIMTHFEDNISVLRSQGITLPYYGTVVQARASGARHWLALPVCHAKLAQQPDKAKIEHVHQALIMRLRQSPSVDCWIKAGHSSIARAFQIVPTNDTQSTVR